MDAAIGVMRPIDYSGIGYGEEGWMRLCCVLAPLKRRDGAPFGGAVSLVRNLCSDDLFARQFFRPDDQACLAASRPQFAIKGCQNDLRVQGFLP